MLLDTQHLTYTLQSAPQVRFHGAQGHRRGLGDLVVRHPVVDRQAQHALFIGAQLRQRFGSTRRFVAYIDGEGSLS